MAGYGLVGADCRNSVSSYLSYGTQTKETKEMNRFSGALVALIGVVTLGISTSVLADNLLGVYVGAGVGQSQIGNNNNYFNPNGYGGPFHDRDASWKVLVGMRPLPFVGAELEYIDFGNARGDAGYYSGNYDYGINAHPKATVLYGLGYLPLPLPFLDVYGKLGIARLQTNNSFSYDISCATSLSGTCSVASRFDQQNTKVAYGAGVQAKFQDFALRGEYERISSTYGDPNTFMVSLTWTF